MTDHTTVLDIASRTVLIKPEPRVPIAVRVATVDDFAFIDQLQKQHSKALGFMPRKQLEAYIESGDVLIAEQGNGEQGAGSRSEDRHSCESRNPQAFESAMPAVDARFRGHDGGGKPLGYCIGRDRYFKREDVGIIYQLVVGESERRSLVGAMLVQAMFEKAAYGCKLFCCWCAQDLEANHFWEACGFVPLAFRAGSEKKQRVHIFWQKRIREGDTQTDWWFPSQTTGGAMREDRLAIPIPPNVHWSDAKPILLPEIPGVDRFIEEEVKALPGDGGEGKANSTKRKAKSKQTKPKQARRGLWFVDPTAEPEVAEKPKKRASKPRVKRKYHPKYIAAARELCARYFEEVQAGRLLPEEGAQGKYDVSRQLAAAPSQMMAMEQDTPELPMLDAA